MLHGRNIADSMLTRKFRLKKEPKRIAPGHIRILPVRHLPLALHKILKRGAEFHSKSLQKKSLYNIIANAPHTPAERRSFRKVAAATMSGEVKTKKED